MRTSKGYLFGDESGQGNWREGTSHYFGAVLLPQEDYPLARQYARRVQSEAERLGISPKGKPLAENCPELLMELATIIHDQPWLISTFQIEPRGSLERNGARELASAFEGFVDKAEEALRPMRPRYARLVASIREDIHSAFEADPLQVALLYSFFENTASWLAKAWPHPHARPVIAAYLDRRKRDGAYRAVGRLMLVLHMLQAFPQFYDMDPIEFLNLEPDRAFTLTLSSEDLNAGLLVADHVTYVNAAVARDRPKYEPVATCREVVAAMRREEPVCPYGTPAAVERRYLD